MVAGDPQTEACPSKQKGSDSENKRQNRRAKTFKYSESLQSLIRTF